MGIDKLLQVVFELAIIGLIFWLIWWFIDYIGLPEPFAKVAKVIVGVVVLLLLISLLLGFLGHQPLLLRR